MKDKLKPNMYVRTKYGISQYKQHMVIGMEDITGILCKDGSRVIFANIEDIIGEPSFNLIDLIEVGDYVNGRLVCKNDEEGCLYLIGFDADGNFYEDSIKDIRTIVTKEQFSSMAYRLGDE